MRARLVLLLLLLAPDAVSCALDPDDRAFIERAIGSWEKVRKEALRLPRAPLPQIVLFDARCQWRGDDLSARGVEHGGRVRLPDGAEMPAQITAFAANAGGRPFLVMALPEVWRASQRDRENPRLDLMLRAVFAHEMSHTRQAKAYGARIDAIAAKHGLGDDFDDDLIQDRFGSDPELTAAWERERDLFFEAARDRDRAKAARALDLMKERRARWLSGDKAFYAELEDLFLTMEGAGNWAGFRVARDAGLTQEEAVAFMRGSRRWTQDEGLAIFLVLDAFLPRWRREVFGREAVSLTGMLERATALAQR